VRVWLPQIAVAGMAVYTGDRFPAWKGNEDRTVLATDFQ
jgi:glucose/arabinose dehydrogenase